MLQNVFLHPGLFKETLLRLRDRAAPAVGDRPELPEAAQDLEPRPFGFNRGAEGAVLVEDDVNDCLIRDFLYLVRVLVPDLPQRARDGVGAAPGLQVDWAGFLIEQDLDNPVEPSVDRRRDGAGGLFRRLLDRDRLVGLAPRQ